MTSLEIISTCLEETQTQLESIKTMQEHGYYSISESKKRIKEEYERASQFIRTLYMYNMIERELLCKSIESLNDLVY